jgi:hypothetical protein
LQAPTAERRPKQLSMHNDLRDDPYYWLRDDERKDPAVSGSCDVWVLSVSCARRSHVVSKACIMHIVTLEVWSETAICSRKHVQTVDGMTASGT